jgi:hypothetical protein
MCIRRNSDSDSLDKGDPIFTRMSRRTVCTGTRVGSRGKLKMEIRLSALPRLGQSSRA